MKKHLISLTLILSALLPAALTAKVPASVSRAVRQAQQAPQMQVSCTINDQPCTIITAGQCFSMDFGQDKIYFDGTTQWAYSAADNEVYITTPTPEELALVNPLQILGRLETEFSGTAVSGSPNTVRLTRINPSTEIKEIVAEFNPSTGWPSEMRIAIDSGQASVAGITITALRTKPAAKAFKFSPPSGTTVTDLR